MTAYRAGELAEKYEHMSEQCFYIYKATHDPKYKRVSYYYREVSQGLYIAAEALENGERRSTWE